MCLCVRDECEQFDVVILLYVSVTVASLVCVCVCVSMNIVKWSSQGMLRLTQEAMNELFQPTIVNIVKHIGEKYTNTGLRTHKH